MTLEYICNHQHEQTKNGKSTLNTTWIHDPQTFADIWKDHNNLAKNAENIDCVWVLSISLFDHIFSTDSQTYSKRLSFVPKHLLNSYAWEKYPCFKNVYY